MSQSIQHKEWDINRFRKEVSVVHYPSCDRTFHPPNSLERNGTA
jgi:hypothetical protein